MYVYIACLFSFCIFGFSFFSTSARAQSKTLVALEEKRPEPRASQPSLDWRQCPWLPSLSSPPSFLHFRVLFTKCKLHRTELTRRKQRQRTFSTGVIFLQFTASSRPCSGTSLNYDLSITLRGTMTGSRTCLINDCPQKKTTLSRPLRKHCTRNNNLLIDVALTSRRFPLRATRRLSRGQLS